jgi:phosphate acetyltransferase
MSELLENHTIDELRVGETASVRHTLHRRDLRLWSALTGNPGIDDGLVQGRGAGTWAMSLFANLIGTTLPGSGSVIQSVTSQFRKPITIDEPVIATVTVTEVRKSTATVQIDCRCTDTAGAVIADARVQVGAPTTKVRKPRPMHELDELLERCKGIKPIATGVVYPCTADALLGAVEASANGLIDAVLFGPEATIRKLAAENKVDLARCRLVATSDPEEAAAKAAAAAGAGDLHALMKGSLHTDQFMHAVVSKESNLRTGRLLSHCMLVAAPTHARRIIISDAAVNIAPTVDQKKDIIQNAIILARSIGIDEPKVAVLSAVEVVRSKMPSTMEAAALAKMADRRQIAGGIVDGPLDLDIAVDAETARIKGLVSPVAGQAEILIAPDIDAGNMMYKELSFVGSAQAAGLVMGGRVPVILTSRSDSPETRLFSAALAALFANAITKDPGLLHRQRASERSGQGYPRHQFRFPIPETDHHEAGVSAQKPIQSRNRFADDDRDFGGGRATGAPWGPMIVHWFLG